MRSVICKSAILLALVTSAGFPNVTRADNADWPASPSGLFCEDIETTGSIDRLASIQILPLSDEQRGFVFLGVTALPDVPVVDALAPPLAAPVPESIVLQDLPAMVVRKVPDVRDHKFVKYEDRILIVRPGDRVVVVEIPIYRLLP
jgi:hypothetical protein